ncbi:mitochondrial import inner membrane translocase subunit TIM14-like [Mya arenaria]|uniref:mitochondrial import inner membrane translocase subunit TIM14-like n=1 Tax=Mya arenaria TaxID=6604 RepID=UPI0022E41EB4|nr:mitochondrial import inner membrane translocase subunit TIM14-like [Mya arenaria]XP_052785023.1 mitochondrial import inner membrane translocase subunit TIM14-like [Mya arenaria]
MTSMILAGLGLTTAAVIGRQMLKHRKVLEQAYKKADTLLPKDPFSKYYRGGFEKKMSKREASLILGVSQSSSPVRIKEAHKRIMLLNHPDRGGSPYLATKINEAKDYLESKKP